MKKFLLLTLAFTTQILFAQEQTIRVVFEMGGQTDSSDINSSFTETMFLDIYSEVSVFQSRNKYLRDSIFNNPAFQQSIMSSGKIDMAGFPTAKILFKIVKNRKPKEIVFQNQLGANRFQYITSRDSFNWQLHDDTASFNGFLCYKATTKFGGRNYTAWYTTEIPISEGPYKFCNLPGLIINITDDKNYYSFKMTAIYNNSTFELIEDKTQYVTVSRSQYLNYLEEIKKNPELLFQVPQGVQVTSANGESYADIVQKRIQIEKEKWKKRNNPLELF